MGKNNKKGKQKQDEPANSSSQTQPSTVEKVKVISGKYFISLFSPFCQFSLDLDNSLNVDNIAEAKGDVWGATASAAWGTFPPTEPQAETRTAQGTFPVTEPQAETWPAQGTFLVAEPQVETWTAHDGEEWHTAEALLQPPAQLHSNLPTIPEQPTSGNFAQNRALSEIEESPDEYDESWHRSESNSTHHSESRTVTAAAPSIGSPTAPQEQSTSVLQEAMKKILTQGTSTASEAARKMEKAKVVQFREPVEKPDPHQGSSSASAAAAAAESSRKRTQASNPGKKPSSSKTIPWTYPKEFKPGARPPAPLPVDPSWISTGGNAWSNKHRNGFQSLRPLHSAQPQFQQPQLQQKPQFQQHSRFQQNPQFQQQPQFQHAQHTHQRHQSHPTRPQMRQTQTIRPLYKVQIKDRQDWQDWGKGQWAQSTGTGSDDETVTEHEGDQWGRGDVWGQDQNATGGEWGHGVADERSQTGWGQSQNTTGGWGHNTGEGRGQRTGSGWDQGAVEGWGGQGTGDAWGQSTGGWEQKPTNPKKDGGMRKSQPKKGGDEWGRGEGAWGQGHQVSGQKGRQQQGDPWGHLEQESNPRQTQDAWGQHTNPQSGQGGDAWGQGASTWGQDTKPRGGDTWGQNSNHQSGQGGDAWGQDTQGGDAWSRDTNHLGGQGGDTWGQDANQGGDIWGQGTSTWDAGDTRKLGGEWAGGATSHTGWGDEAQRLPKLTTASEAVGGRNVLSGQQRSQILSNLLNKTQTQNIKGGPSAAKHGAQKKTEHEQWGAWEARDHGWGSEDEDDEDDTRRVRFSPKASELWGESPRSIPSKTLARTQQGIMTTSINDPDNVRFVESKGAAFEYVTNAFFGNFRFARERIHWLFPSDKDPRVAAMLAWVQRLSYNLGTFGVRPFISILFLLY